MFKRFFKSKKGATNTTEIPMWVVVVVIAAVIIAAGVFTHLGSVASSAGTQTTTSETSAVTKATAITVP